MALDAKCGILSIALTTLFGVPRFGFVVNMPFLAFCFYCSMTYKSAEYLNISALFLRKCGMSIAERLKEARASLGLKQDEMVAISGIPLDTYRKYEGGKSEPGSRALAGIAKAGVDLNWLITGVRYTTDEQGRQYFVYPSSLTSPLVDNSSAVATQRSVAPKNPSHPKINVDALAHAYAVTLQTAPKGETLAESARKAVAFYQYCWENGLISEEGEANGNLSGAA